MARFAQRPFEWVDIDERFEALSAQRHARNAVRYIQRLERDGAIRLKNQPQQAIRWQELCRELTQYIRNLGTDDTRDLATDLREFIHALEHARYRAYQISYGADEFGSTFSVGDCVGLV